jgi:hypothetical protein
VAALRAPKQEPETARARMMAPGRPKTAWPNATATVFEELMTAEGSTRKYATFAARYASMTPPTDVWMTRGRSREGLMNSPVT